MRGETVRRRLFFISCFILFLFSCATVSIEEHPDTITVSVSEVQKSPDTYTGKSVTWGGFIAETSNRQEGSYVTIVKTSLDASRRPVDTDLSDGRFIAFTKDFLDPAIFARNREITIAGTITGIEAQPIGELSYHYPVVSVNSVRLWDKRAPDYYWHDPLFFYPAPYWYPYPYRHHWRRHHFR